MLQCLKNNEQFIVHFSDPHCTSHAHARTQMYISFRGLSWSKKELRYRHSLLFCPLGNFFLLYGKKWFHCSGFGAMDQLAKFQSLKVGLVYKQIVFRWFEKFPFFEWAYWNPRTLNIFFIGLIAGSETAKTFFRLESVDINENGCVILTII